MKKIYIILGFTLLSLIGYSQEENKKPEAQRASKANNGKEQKEQTKLPELKRADMTVSDNKEKAQKNKSAQPEKLRSKEQDN